MIMARLETITMPSLKSNNIEIKNKLSSPSASVSTREQYDYATWQMYHRIVASRMNRRRVSPQMMDSATVDKTKDPPTKKEPANEETETEDLIFELEL
mmetsp:Transcript_33034/g.46900  ORF Transcript_33034/g.46900 Transcript_33034/m.46900 type:complete len:98 (-) Transcript_33034:319-612(-)